MEQDKIFTLSSLDETGVDTRQARSTMSEETTPSTQSTETPETNLRPTVTTPKKKPLFRLGKISIAVDVSGSTYGTVIEAELKAIRSICSLFPLSSRSEIKILPWSNTVQTPIRLEDIDEIDSYGDTDPSALLHDDACRYELQNSSFWFLMTDGDIFDEEIRAFAKSLVEYSLHGLASVVAIFGERESPPSKCNISVGLSVFAVSPHCAFLYTDVETSKTYILQTKGCFSALLPKGTTNPKLDASTAWTDLPQTSYENLARVPIPPPQSVSKDEVVLEDNWKINLSALLSSPTVDLRTASRILDHEDSTKTVALTAKLQGRSEQFRRWLDNVESTAMDTLNPDRIERPQANGNSSILEGVIANIIATENSNVEIEELRKELRNSNSRDLEALESMVQQTSLQSHRRRSSGGHGRRLSNSSLSIAEDNIGSFDFEHRVQISPHSWLPHAPARELYPILQSPGVDVNIQQTSLMNPGFRRPDFQRDYYRGSCMLCASNELVMALVLRNPPDHHQVVTTNFPPSGGSSYLRYPLTMGNYVETDIISPLLACDPCSFRLLKRGRISSGDEISNVLPLLSFSKNQFAWLETVNRATQKRFKTEELPLIFLAILYTAQERLLEKEDSRAAVHLRPALEWACANLLHEVELTDPVSLENITLGSAILKLFRSALDSVGSVDLLMYPIDGFVVANVALSNSDYKTQISASKRQQLVFHRFLYHLTEQYFKLSAALGEMALQAAMMLILILDESVGPRSLLTLKTLRQVSMQFSTLQEMMQGLQSSLKWRPRKYNPKKLSISVKDLLNTPLLDARSLRDFRRLGSLFAWIEDKAAHAIAAYLHYLFCMENTENCASERFITIRNQLGMARLMSNPEEMSAKKVEDLIKSFPPLVLTTNSGRIFH